MTRQAAWQYYTRDFIILDERIYDDGDAKREYTDSAVNQVRKFTGKGW